MNRASRSSMKRAYRILSIRTRAWRRFIRSWFHWSIRKQRKIKKRSLKWIGNWSTKWLHIRKKKYTISYSAEWQRMLCLGVSILRGGTSLTRRVISTGWKAQSKPKIKIWLAFGMIDLQEFVTWNSSNFGHPWNGMRPSFIWKIDRQLPCKIRQWQVQRRLRKHWFQTSKTPVTRSLLS